MPYSEVEKFWDYLLFYPEEDEEGFDGIHFGGIKGIKSDVPGDIREAYENYMKFQKYCENEKIKI